MKNPSITFIAIGLTLLAFNAAMAAEGSSNTVARSPVEQSHSATMEDNIKCYSQGGNCSGLVGNGDSPLIENLVAGGKGLAPQNAPGKNIIDEAEDTTYNNEVGLANQLDSDPKGRSDTISVGLDSSDQGTK